MFNLIYTHISRIYSACIDIIFPDTKEALEVKNLTTRDIEHLPTSTLPLVLWHYQNPLVREIIWQIKYYENDTLIEKIIPHLSDMIQQEILEKKQPIDTILLPVPLSKQRREDRGYNQTEKIASALYQNLCKTYPTIQYKHNLLQKQKHTESQTHKNKGERACNLKNSFSIIGTLPMHTHIILIDDVITTGATMNEISTLLRSHGFIHIHKVALAH